MPRGYAPYLALQRVQHVGESEIQIALGVQPSAARHVAEVKALRPVAACLAYGGHVFAVVDADHGEWLGVRAVEQLRTLHAEHAHHQHVGGAVVDGLEAGGPKTAGRGLGVARGDGAGHWRAAVLDKTPAAGVAVRAGRDGHVAEDEHHGATRDVDPVRVAEPSDRVAQFLRIHGWRLSISHCRAMRPWRRGRMRLPGTSTRPHGIP